jgi:hypothetical protein
MEFSLLGLRLKDTKDEISLSNNIFSSCSTIIQVLSVPKENHGDVQELDDDGDVDGDVGGDVGGDVDVTCGEYDMYSKIETHMSFSASLYILNRQGVAILKELDTKKVKRNDQKVVINVVGRIYMELLHCINANRIISDLYTNLISQLDNVMFDECGELDTFYVKEEEYTLESLYYKQGSWVDEIEWHEPQFFLFNMSVDIDEGECMYLLMFLKKYLSLLSMIQKEYDHHKLHSCLEKIRYKLTNAHNILVDELCTFMEQST